MSRHWYQDCDGCGENIGPPEPNTEWSLRVYVAGSGGSCNPDLCDACRARIAAACSVRLRKLLDIDEQGKPLRGGS